MALTIDYNGAPLGYDVPPTKVDMPNRAELGAISMGSISPEDPTAALTLIGHKPVHIDETLCSQPRLFTGWTVERNMGRSFDQAEFIGANALIHDTSIVDLNAALGFRIITWTDGNRPEESVDDRLAWLLASNYVAGPDGTLFEDTGFVHTGFSLFMDACDYRGSYPADVLADMSTRYATVINYFVFWDATAGKASLFWNYIGAATFGCTISISNDVADTYADDVPDATCFAPITESRLERTPEAVYSDVIVNYTGGSCYRILNSTAVAFIKRGTSISRPHIGKLATAQAAGDAWLAQHNVETDRITTTIHVPADTVGLIQAGMRMEVKFTHLTDYTSFTWMRIVACTPRPMDDLARFYDVDLELVAPRLTPTVPLYAELQDNQSQQDLCGSIGTESETWYDVGWRGCGDDPSGGYANAFKTGAVDYTDYPCIHIGEWKGFELLDDAVVDLTQRGDFLGVAGGTGAYVTAEIMQNAVVIASATETDSTGGGLHPFGATITLSVTGIVGVVGDLFRVRWKWGSNWASYPYYRQSPGDYQCRFTISGVSTPSTIGGIVPTVTQTQAATDPTVTDDLAAGYLVGSTWINTTSGEQFVLVDDTTGAAVWQSTTSSGGGGAPTDADYLVGTAQAGLSAEIVVGTTPGGELGGTWASPTVDATHSGSPHHALVTLAASADELLGLAGQALSLDTQDANTVLAGPIIGSAAAPEFRVLVAADIPGGIGGGELLISDTPSTPLIFADILQNEAQDDFLYSG